MNPSEHKNWLTVKGLITPIFGTVSACAAHRNCSPDGLRKAVQGKYPHITKRLQRRLGWWERNEE